MQLNVSWRRILLILLLGVLVLRLHQFLLLPLLHHLLAVLLVVCKRE